MTRQAAKHPPLRYVDGDPVAFQALNEIGIIAQLSRAQLERAAGDDLSAAGFSVLNHLARLPGDWGPARLACAFQVTKGAMTNTLQRLEAKGLVRVRPAPGDGRGKLVEITHKGRRARQRTLDNLAPAIAVLTRAFDDDAFRALLPGLARLRALLDAARD